MQQEQDGCPSYIGYTVQNLQTLAEATITGKTDDNTLTLSADIFTETGHWYWIKGVLTATRYLYSSDLNTLYGEIWDWVSGVNIDVSANGSKMEVQEKVKHMFVRTVNSCNHYT